MLKRDDYTRSLTLSRSWWCCSWKQKQIIRSIRLHLHPPTWGWVFSEYGGKSLFDHGGDEFICLLFKQSNIISAGFISLKNPSQSHSWTLLTGQIFPLSHILPIFSSSEQKPGGETSRTLRVHKTQRAACCGVTGVLKAYEYRWQFRGKFTMRVRILKLTGHC